MDNQLEINSSAFWDARYSEQQTGWDLGAVSPPLKAFIDTIEDKSLEILIPGAGNAYEATYLIEQGFTDVTVIDIAPTLVAKLKNQFAGNPNIQIIGGDFFDLIGNYDLILEQTFFCALPPVLRPQYVTQMHKLLKPNGKLCGLLFNRAFEGGPPFGGSKEEYEELFKRLFTITKMDTAFNSVKPRAGSELWVEFERG